MAPFPITLLPPGFEPQPQPHLEIRENGASPYQITLTITRATTTITTAMVLGSATSNPNPRTTQTSTPQTTLAPAPSSGGNNSTVVGAIIGSLVGFIVLMGLLWCCCYGNNSYFTSWRTYDDSDSYLSYSDSSSSPSSRSVTYRRAVPRPGFAWQNTVGRGVRVPERVKVTRERARVERSSSGTRTTTTSSGRYRRRRVRRQSSFWGWPFAAPRDRVVTSRWAGRREQKFSIDD